MEVSGAGKTTIAQRICKEQMRDGQLVVLLDGVAAENESPRDLVALGRE